ncbi:transcriptional regulator [Pseudoduganella sp. OTU4001]|uniref:transcriptional regulator n=1 Tax=Pseudoduganella sp. OTU4001 TaxID=3043854 RepID=UPI00313CB4CE
MKSHIVFLASIAAYSLLALAEPTAKLDQSWFLAGENPEHYQIGADPDGVRRGSVAKFLRARTDKHEAWATLMQSVAADDYRGKRVRFSAQVRTENIGNWSGLWMRVDREDGSMGGFYNSQDKPIKGSHGWHLRSVTLDVADDARTLNFGVNGGGGGTVWIDELKMEIVDNSVPVDKMPPREYWRSLSTKPSL